jgi:cellulose synthase/poly-beta-1,6-N-acetylglucosamine synthase-like glycosyltransferase
MLSVILAALYLLAVVLLAIWGLHNLLLTIVSRRHHRAPLPVPSTSDDRLPTVTIQLPCYNEKFVIGRLIAACAAQDYPHDRLEIQVLDDSTDDTVHVVAEAVERARRQGIDVHHIRRNSRAGYKAGALYAALDQTRGELQASFDSDVVPPPDFLRRSVPFLVADPTLGCIQGRWTWLNGDESALTRAQRAHHDSQCLIEQLGRNRNGLPMMFMGGSGVWRRQAILDAGNWAWDTLHEDMDLSYRAQLAGWPILLLPEVETPSELPPQVAAVRKQQGRWAKGAMQTTMKILPRLWRSRRLSMLAKIAGTLHMAWPIYYAALLTLLLVTLPLLLLGGLPDTGLLGLLAAGGPLVMYAAVEARERGNRAALTSMPLRMLLWAGLSVTIVRGLLSAFARRPNRWSRTPKFGTWLHGGAWASVPYVFAVDHIVWVELALAAYGLLSAGAALQHAHWAAAALTFVMCAGLGWVSIGTLYQAAIIYAGSRCWQWHRG